MLQLKCNGSSYIMLDVMDRDVIAQVAYGLYVVALAAVFIFSLAITWLHFQNGGSSQQLRKEKTFQKSDETPIPAVIITGNIRSQLKLPSTCAARHSSSFLFLFYYYYKFPQLTLLLFCTF